VTDTFAEAEPRLGRVGTFVDETVRDLQGRFLRERQDPAAVAGLARLRRAVGKPPGAVMDVLEFTYHPVLSPGAADEPTPAERAAHVAITLYAAHQQSRGEGMHRRRRGLGTALRGLAAGSEADIPDPIARRFRMLGTADSFDELTHHLRGVVQLLRADSAPLDYGRLADQLHHWQRGGRDQVRMTWGREFYRQNRTTAKTDSPETKTANDQETA
jgi:CRISPR system Cascade subunit CasB